MTAETWLDILDAVRVEAEARRRIVTALGRGGPCQATSRQMEISILREIEAAVTQLRRRLGTLRRIVTAIADTGHHAAAGCAAAGDGPATLPLIRPGADWDDEPAGELPPEYTPGSSPPPRGETPPARPR